MKTSRTCQFLPDCLLLYRYGDRIPWDSHSFCRRQWFSLRGADGSSHKGRRGWSAILASYDPCMVYVPTIGLVYHTCIHACMHACMHAYIHTYIHTYMKCHGISRNPQEHPMSSSSTRPADDAALAAAKQPRTEPASVGAVLAAVTWRWFHVDVDLVIYPAKVGYHFHNYGLWLIYIYIYIHIYIYIYILYIDIYIYVYISIYLSESYSILYL